MRLTGILCTVGDLMASDAPALVDVPALQLRIADGRIVTLTGLTRDECREAAEWFLDPVTLTLASPNPNE